MYDTTLTNSTGDSPHCPKEFASVLRCYNQHYNTIKPHIKTFIYKTESSWIFSARAANRLFYFGHPGSWPLLSLLPYSLGFHLFSWDGARLVMPRFNGTKKSEIPITGSIIRRHSKWFHTLWKPRVECIQDSSDS